MGPIHLPSIAQSFSIHSSSPDIEFHSYFFFTTDVSTCIIYILLALKGSRERNTQTIRRNAFRFSMYLQNRICLKTFIEYVGRVRGRDQRLNCILGIIGHGLLYSLSEEQFLLHKRTWTTLSKLNIYHIKTFQFRWLVIRINRGLLPKALSTYMYSLTVSDIHTYLTRSTNDYRITFSKRKFRNFCINTTGSNILNDLSPLYYVIHPVLFCKKIFAGTKRYLPVLTLAKCPCFSQLHWNFKQFLTLSFFIYQYTVTARSVTKEAMDTSNLYSFQTLQEWL